VFKPQRLDRHALDVQVGPVLRSMPPAMRDELVEREQDLAQRFDLWSPRNVRRVQHYVAGSLVGLPLLNWLFTPLGFHALWIQLPIAGVFGVVMGLFSPRGVAAGFLLVGTGLLTLLLAGYGLSFSFGSVIVFVAYFAIGLALGVSENLSRDERS
jgi:hypothetical protein